MSAIVENVLFKGALTGTYKPSKAFLIKARSVVFRLQLTVAGAPATVLCYMEFAGSPDGPWCAEMAEEDAGDGAVAMPLVIRTVMANGGGSLPVGTTNASMQFVRDEQYVRLQLKSAGSVSAIVSSPFGLT